MVVFMENICKKLVHFRGEKSQEEIAKIYGVSQQAWSKYERGLMLPSFRLMLQLEKDADVPMEDLFFETINNQRLLNAPQLLTDADRQDTA
jgi:transcriptional regulator with XRE-family HTH domain